MVHSIDCYVEEVPDYGVERYVETWAEAGLTRLRPTLAYHVARIFSPANPKRKLLDLEGDMCFLPESSAEHFHGQLLPQFSKRSAGVLEEIAAAASARGIGLDGWTVFNNNWQLAVAHPEYANVSATGSPDKTWFSPAHPEVREYCVGLVRAAGASGLFDVLQCEALYHVPFPAHPVDRVNIIPLLSPLDVWLCGVCVSEHSLAMVERCGGDGARLAATIKSHLDGRLERRGPELPLTLEALAELLGDDATPLVESRGLSVTETVKAMAEEAAKWNLKLEWEEDVSSWESFFSGVQEGPLSSQRQWEVGVDRDGIAASIDEVGLLLYFSDEDRFRRELADAIETFGRVPRVLLRPFSPDIEGPEDLASKLSILAEAGVPETVYYMQSLMMSETPDLVGRAIEIAGE